MNGDDIISLLDEIWEHFDNLSDIHSDGSPNEALRFCARIDEAQSAIRRMVNDLHTVGSQIRNWQEDVRVNLNPLPTSMANAADIADIRKRLGGVS